MSFVDELVLLSADELVSSVAELVLSSADEFDLSSVAKLVLLPPDELELSSDAALVLLSADELDLSPVAKLVLLPPDELDLSSDAELVLLSDDELDLSLTGALSDVEPLALSVADVELPLPSLDVSVLNFDLSLASSDRSFTAFSDLNPEPSGGLDVGVSLLEPVLTELSVGIVVLVLVESAEFVVKFFLSVESFCSAFGIETLPSTSSSSCTCLTIIARRLMATGFSSGVM